MTVLTSMMLNSGYYFNLASPRNQVYLISDVCHVLSRIPRYNGHSIFPWTVAQHSVLVSYLVPEVDAYTGLMHDVSETYTGDINTLLKNVVPEFRRVEDDITEAASLTFGFTYPLPKSVKQADLLALAMERQVLMPKSRYADDENIHWKIIKGLKFRDDLMHMIKPQSTIEIEKLFMSRYNEILISLGQLP